MLIMWIRKMALAAIILGFFLPFINTCTKKDRFDRENKMEASNTPSFTKPDGKNYSGIGYIVSDFAVDNALVWLLIISVSTPLLLIMLWEIGKPVLNVFAFASAVIGVSGLAVLLYFELIENLKYGFWISLMGYMIYLLSFIVLFFNKYYLKMGSSKT